MPARILGRCLALNALIVAIATAAGCAQGDATNSTDRRFNGGRDNPTSMLDGGSGVFDPDIPTDPVDPATLGLADGLRINTVSVLQSLEIPIFGPNAAMRTVPIIAGKPMALRVGVTADAGYRPQRIHAILETGSGTYEDARTISGPSTEADPGSYFYLPVPAESVSASAGLRLRLLAPSGSPQTTNGHPATWPAGGGMHPLAAALGAPLRVMAIVVHNQASPNQGRLNLTPERIAAIRAALVARMPISEATLQIIVRPQPHVTSLRPDIDAQDRSYHDRLLDEIAALYHGDGAPANTVYLGLTSYDQNAFACEGCPAGIAMPVEPHELTAPPYGRAAVSNYFETETLTDTAAADFVRQAGSDPSQIDAVLREYWSYAYQQEFPQYEPFRDFVVGQPAIEINAHSTIPHEILHTFAFDHVACPGQSQEGNFLDTTFPRPDGSLGLTGYDFRSGRLMPSAGYRDFMSYCLATWISDQNYRLMHERFNAVAGVATAASRRQPAARPAGRPRTIHYRALVSNRDGALHYPEVTGTIPLPKASLDAVGNPNIYPATAYDEQGNELGQTAAVFRRFSEGTTGVLYFEAIDNAVRYELDQSGKLLALEIPKSARESFERERAK